MTEISLEVMQVAPAYNRIAKLKPSTILEKESQEPRELVTISAEAKKKQILDQAKGEVLERIRGAL